MIPGFEEYTAPLTDYEKNVVASWVAQILRRHEGADAAITNKQIRTELALVRVECSDAALRAVINYIRIKNIVPGVLASSRGYYVETSRNAVEEYCRSLTARANAILAVKASLLESIDGKLF